MLNPEPGTPVNIDVYQWQWVTDSKIDQVLVARDVETVIHTPRKFRDSGISFPCGSSVHVDYKGRSYPLAHESNGYSILIGLRD